MGDPTSNRATLRNKFELEKRHRSYADFRSKAVKSQPEIESSSPSNCRQKHKGMEMEEIVKHMKHLPSYLKTNKPTPDRALSFGVMDWGRLEKWQYQHHKTGFVKSDKCSPSSSNYSSLFSTDGSSPRSSRDQSCSPARQKVHRVTLQSHFKLSPTQDFTPHKLQYFKDDDLPEKPENVLDSARNQNGPTRNKTPERKTSTGSSKNSDLKTGHTEINKPRSISPLRRFSFSHSMSSRTESPVSQSPTKDSKRAHSSPLRRLLDPIFPSTGHEDSRTKAKVKLDFKSSKEIRVDDHVPSSSSSRKQALFQTTVKNGRLLFTFAVENNKDILAATVSSLSSSEKDNNKNSLYTFFNVHEVKTKNMRWLSPGSKIKDHGYVPNITAQMKVSNSDCDTREFVLFSVNPNVQPQELEAIVVKFSRNVNCEDNQERLSTTVILPGGSHGVPSKGEPSPLIDRWRSGGGCDCGGWDVGCRLRTCTNEVQSSGSRLDKAHMTDGKFELFFQGEAGNNRPIFSLSPLKEGIFSIEYNSSLSPLQAFSICISIVESRKTPHHTQQRTHILEGVPVIYTPIPAIKRNATGKVVSCNPNV